MPVYCLHGPPDFLSAETPDPAVLLTWLQLLQEATRATRTAGQCAAAPQLAKKFLSLAPFTKSLETSTSPGGQAQSSPLLGPWASLPLGFPIGRRGTLTTRPSPGLLP